MALLLDKSKVVDAYEPKLVHVKVDGKTVEVPKGCMALYAIRAAGLDVPTVCHDPRLKPAGSCRVCMVNVRGFHRPMASCSLPVKEGMEITVNSPEAMEGRRGTLTMLARNYPKAYVEELPEKPFHRHLAEQGLFNVLNGAPCKEEIDDSNPYFRFDPAACIECYRCVRICSELQGAFVWEILERGLETKARPVSLLASTDSLCKSCGACVDTCPTGALVDKNRLEMGMPQKWTRTTCPYCGVGCEMWVGTRNDRIVQSLPVIESPVNKGHLCVKGRYAHAFVHSPDRLSTPLIRRNGKLEEANWEEAVSFVAREFKNILREQGPTSIGVLGSARAPNEDNYLAQKFARVVLGTNNVDCCARVCHGPTAAAMKAMLGTGAATNSFDDIEKARTIFIAGSNATECHPIVGQRIIQATRNGAKLVVVDPRKTELAALADVHLQLRPGTNIPLFNALAYVVIEEGLANGEFLDSRVGPLEEFRAFVQDYAPEAVAELCGVQPEDIRRAARLYATQTPSMCMHGLGMTEHLQGSEGVMCLVNLALLTGNMGKPGSGINPLRGQNNVQGSAHMGCEPSNLTGFVSLQDGRELFESVWNTTLPQVKGLNLMGMMDEAHENRFKALWAIGYDLLFTNANAQKSRESLRNMELVVVQDLFLNETAREFAHVVLPACSSFERDGTFMNAERRVSRVRKALDPVGDSKPDWEIIQLVAQAMGHKKGFSFRSAQEIWEEVRRVWKPGAGMSYQRLEEAGLQWPCTSEDHPGTAVLHTERFPVGVKADLKCIEYTPTPERVSEEFPLLLHTGRSIYQFNAGTMTMRTANQKIRPTDSLDMTPEDAKTLGLAAGQRVRITSRHGQAELPLRISKKQRRGEVFATFHDPEVFLNRVTGNVRDRIVGAPEYKVTAVKVEPATG